MSKGLIVKYVLGAFLCKSDLTGVAHGHVAAIVWRIRNLVSAAGANAIKPALPAAILLCACFKTGATLVVMLAVQRACALFAFLCCVHVS